MYFTLIISLLVTSNSILSTAITISSDEKCVRLEDCPQLDNLIRTKRNHFGTRNLLRLLDNYCADKNREVFVKCVSPSKIVEYMEKSELLPSYENCGTDNLHEKISGGETADLGEYSWIGLLKYRNIVGGINYGCHANLISKKYLLTAAHCVDRSTTSFKMKLLGNVYSVVLGEHDIRNKTDCIYYPSWEFCADEAKEYLIESYTVHPDYDRSSRINDIALIRLNEEVKFSGFIKPICLPPNSLRLNYGETWWITGWGETADYKMNDVKQKAKFGHKKKNECFVSINLTENQLCAGSTANAKTCPGDSGGPLMKISTIGEVDRAFLIGVVSLGTDCNRNLQIAVFTKISAYVDWIIGSLQK